MSALIEGHYLFRKQEERVLGKNCPQSFVQAFYCYGTARAHKKAPSFFKGGAFEHAIFYIMLG